eukprot:6064607-Amphidinium_carterae.1
MAAEDRSIRVIKSRSAALKSSQEARAANKGGRLCGKVGVPPGASSGALTAANVGRRLMGQQLKLRQKLGLNNDTQ